MKGKKEEKAEPAKEPLKIAIFGTTPSRMDGPHQDNSGWLRWTIGPGGKDHHNWEALFELHHVWPEEFKGYLADISKEETRQVWTLRPARELVFDWQMRHKKTEEQLKIDIPGEWKTNRVIPRQILEEKYGRTWFSSSISWLFAMAIEAGAKEIGLWGIDLESGEEYLAQYYGCRHFIDYARNIGINVHLPNGCGLLREPRPYPDRYETNFALHLEYKAKYIDLLLSQSNHEFEALRQEVFRNEGRILALREVQVITENLPEAIMKAASSHERALIETNQKFSEVSAKIQGLNGERGAIEYLRRMYVYNLKDPEQK